MPENPDPAAALLGRTVVVDVAYPIVYIGTLRQFAAGFLVLEDADIHELQCSTVTKEVYVMELRRNGFQPTRRQILIRQEQVLSLSALDDIVVF